MVKQIEFGDISGIDWALNNKLSSHGSSVDHFDEIHEVLFGFETSYKLRVIWRPLEKYRRHQVRCISPTSDIKRAVFVKATHLSAQNLFSREHATRMLAGLHLLPYP